jgi:phytoene desaturase
VEGLYCVGAGYQPGGGTPSVMMSAKITCRAIHEDWLDG